MGGAPGGQVRGQRGPLHDVRGAPRGARGDLGMDRTQRNGVTSLSCVELAAAIRERRTSCVTVMEAVLERAAAVQPKLNCFIRVDAEAALAAAQLADRDIARGYVRGPLHGVPMAHKDMYYRRGVVSSCGSKILRDTPAPGTAKVLEYL